MELYPSITFFYNKKSYIDNFSMFLLFILHNNPILWARLAFFNIWGDWLRLKVKKCAQVFTGKYGITWIQTQ